MQEVTLGIKFSISNAIAWYSKVANLSENSTNAIEDLNFSKEILKRLNVVDLYKIAHQDDKYLPVLDQNPVDLISK